MRDNVQRMRELVRNQNTLRLEVFGSAQAIAYVAKALAFVACVFVVKSSFLKVVDMQRPNAVQIIAMQGTNITVSTNVLQRFLDSQE